MAFNKSKTPSPWPKNETKKTGFDPRESDRIGVINLVEILTTDIKLRTPAAVRGLRPFEIPRGMIPIKIIA